MLTIGSLPSLRGIAEELVLGDTSGQLILFSFPSKQVWLKWQEYFIAAMDACLGENGRGALYDGIISMDPSSENPQNDLAEKLAFDDPRFDELLASYGNDPPIVLELDCDGRLDQAWQSFLSDTAKYYKTNDSAYSKRSICLFLISPPQIQPIEAAPGVRCFAFWNPLQWEEIRLLIGANIDQSDNAISKAWIVSTYAGAANLDPEVIGKLLQREPRSLRDVREIVSTYCDGCKNEKEVSKNFSSLTEEKRWDVPQELSTPWLQGKLHGHTFNRGDNIPWEKCCESFKKTTLDRAVWREQVAGIFPLLMEITAISSEKITQIKGEKWKEECLDTTEPGKILDVFHERNLIGRLPKKLYDLLQNLRISRNKLAHLEPVDFRDVSQIWSLFEQISKTNS
ncbi:hypothetical protein [Desulfogranum marinum]|uniref:hypothetical protein n=1 Tax=Desulfogranum marinum TaxID=453220 RepID=UPI0029C7F7E2|nr:hypothetical protein [Desulfogranum marinum]